MKLVLSIIIILALFNILIDVDSQFIGDDFHQFNTAVGILEDHGLNQYNFIEDKPFRYYPRAATYTLMLAGSMSIFGIGEWQARLPNIIMYIIFIILLYLTTKYYTKDEIISILICIFFVTNNAIIHYVLAIRMYFLVLFTSLVFFYSLSRSIQDIRYIKLAIVSLIFWYTIHITALIFIPLLIFAVIYYFFKDIKKSIIISFIVSLPIILYIFISHYGRIELYDLTIFNYTIVSSYLGIPLYLGVFLVLLSLYRSGNKILYLFYIWLYLHIVFIFIRYYHTMHYIIYILPITFILIFMGLKNILSLFKIDRASIYLTILLFILILNLNIRINPVNTSSYSTDMANWYSDDILDLERDVDYSERYYEIRDDPKVYKEGYNELQFKSWYYRQVIDGIYK